MVLIKIPEREIGFKIKLTEETGLVLAWSPGPASLTSSGEIWRSNVVIVDCKIAGMDCAEFICSPGSSA